ncbi:MAG: tyrosine protein phosphatase [Cohaesibacter sp.]|nr:tyrosine protein phosphatase [Cohaesibacter sp.]MCV6600337.1 tyrosine protein phosphatase [Cohaesibacter sp.]
MLYVCSLARMPELVERLGASHLVSVLNSDMEVKRPKRIDEKDHLFLGMNDIVVETPGFEMGSKHQVKTLISFIRNWDQSAPLVLHCWAGVSRSTASAYIAACALNPDMDETQIAKDLRQASPSATPNLLLVSLADDLLKRQGRMVAAIEAIGRGAYCYEGDIFAMPHIRT